MTSFLPKGCRGAFASTRKVAGFRIMRPMVGGSPPLPLARPGWLLSAGGSQNGSEENRDWKRKGSFSRGWGGASRAILDTCDSLASLTSPQIPFLVNLASRLRSPESLACVGGASTDPQTPCLLQRLYL